MKRFVCVLLVMLIMVPAFSLAETEGITVDALCDRITTDYPGNAFSATSEQKGRTLFTIAAGSISAMSVSYGYTFKNSAVIEFAMESCIADYDDFSPYFLASISQKSTLSERIDDSNQYINLDSELVLSAGKKKWSKNRLVNNYYVEISMQYGGEDGVIWMLLNKNSKLKSKQAASSQFEEYPDMEVMLKLALAPEKSVASEDGTIVLYPGEWVCPDHIPAGEYSVVAVDHGYISIKREGRLVVNEALNPEDNNKIGRVVLKAGDTIHISGGQMSFSVYEK